VTWKSRKEIAVPANSFIPSVPSPASSPLEDDVTAFPMGFWESALVGMVEPDAASSGTLVVLPTSPPGTAETEAEIWQKRAYLASIKSLHKGNILIINNKTKLRVV